jgi:cell division protease FtsH
MLLSRARFVCGDSTRRIRRAATSDREGGSYSRLLREIEAGDIDFARVLQNQQEVYIRKGGEGEGEEKIILPIGNEVLQQMIEHDIPVTIQQLSPKVSPLEVGSIALQLVIVAAILRAVFFSKPINPGGSFGAWKNQEVEPTTISDTFADVAGVEVAKQDLQEIVEFLKFPEKFTKVGAKIPRGVLLAGPPGTGKTLLARAVAGEAGVPFFSCSGSDFIEMFVGVGASRIRDLFAKARTKAPSIIFIDEIDAIGKSRTSSFGGSASNDEKDQTINQLLTEMDGFQGNTGVIVIAATNREDLLDEALTRPGRFDRMVRVDLPDLAGRTDILRIHTMGKPLAEDVDLRGIARNTVGFSGADLANLANEAAIYAARDNREVIQPPDWDRALEKIVLGEERPTLLISEAKRQVLAYHEAGHALLGLLMNDYDVVRKVTIVPRGSAGGVTYFEPDEERIDMQLLTREYLENRIVVALGGRVAEEIVFGARKVTTGASGDFESVMEIAYAMVSSYGFNEELGPIAWADAQIDVSQDIAAEVKHIVEQCYSHAQDLILTHETYLHKIAQALLEKETLDTKDLLALTAGIHTQLPDTSLDFPLQHHVDEEAT